MFFLSYLLIYTSYVVRRGIHVQLLLRFCSKHPSALFSSRAFSVAELVEFTGLSDSLR